MAPKRETISLSSVVVAEPQHVAVNVGEETLILHLETGGYYSLRNVGARIWELLRGPVSVTDLGETLSRQYGIARDRCEADLLELIAGLVERGLVRVVPEDGQAEGRNRESTVP